MSDTVPIGRGLDNSRLYIVGPALHPVPVEMPGELCLVGVLLALGYNNPPSKTQNAFLANPFCREGRHLAWLDQNVPNGRTCFHVEHWNFSAASPATSRSRSGGTELK